MYSKIILAGYLGGDPDLRYTPKGEAVCNFSVAASAGKDDTIWFRVTAWGNQAEACGQYLHKGSLVLVEGRLTHDGRGNPRIFERKSGEHGSAFEVTASNVRFLGGGMGEQMVAE